MSKAMQDNLSYFVQSAMKSEISRIWLLLPSGFLTGKPATFEEYLAQTNRRDPRPNVLQQSQTANENEFLLLTDAEIYTNGRILRIGPAIIKSDQIIGYGIFTKTEQEQN